MFIAPLGAMPFSCFGKKRAKRNRHKGHCASRSRAPNPSPCVSPAALTTVRSTLTYIPEHDKNVPIFAVQGFCFWNSAGRRERSRRNQQNCDELPARRENVTQFFDACGWGTQGRTQFVARERGMSASPVPPSLVTFLCGHKKVTPSVSTIN